MYKYVLKINKIKKKSVKNIKIVVFKFSIRYLVNGTHFILENISWDFGKI